MAAVQRVPAQHCILFPSEVQVKTLPKDYQPCSYGGSCHQCSPQFIAFSPNTFRQYLKQESLDKKRKEFDTNGWQLFSKKSQEIPQQMNGSDCGMFACKYADCITKDRPINFTQQHMPYFRKRMVWEILHRKLL